MVEVDPEVALHREQLRLGRGLRDGLRRGRAGCGRAEYGEGDGADDHVAPLAAVPWLDTETRTRVYRGHPGCTREIVPFQQAHRGAVMTTVAGPRRDPVGG